MRPNRGFINTGLALALAALVGAALIGNGTLSPSARDQLPPSVSRELARASASPALTIRGNEFTGLRKPKNPHILAYDTEWVAEKLPVRATKSNTQDLIDSAAAHGGWCVLAHPMRGWGDSADEVVRRMSRLHGYTGIEAFNGKSIRAGADSEPVWDALLDRSDDRRVWAFGNDDFHSAKDLGASYNIALATTRSVEAVRSALKAGDFYVVTRSPSLRIDGLWTTGKRISVLSNQGARVEFVGPKGVLLVVMGESGSYECSGDEGYVRVRVFERGSEGVAYSQPIAVSSSATLASPYDFTGRQPYKVNLHAHTTVSDAKRGYTPEVVWQLYSAHGYDLLAITDHDWLAARPEIHGPSAIIR